MAKALGVKLITASSTLTCARRVAPLAARHRMQVAMHGHDNTKDPNQFATAGKLRGGSGTCRRTSPSIWISATSSPAGYDPVAYIGWKQQHHNPIVVTTSRTARGSHGPAVPFGEGATPVKRVLELPGRSSTGYRPTSSTNTTARTPWPK